MTKSENLVSHFFFPPSKFEASVAPTKQLKSDQRGGWPPRMGATGSKDKLGGSSSMSGMSGLSGGAGGVAGGDTKQSPELKCAVPVQFRWHHGAQREVYVVGSFSNWQTKIRLTPQEDGHYGTVVQIVPGIHQYKFIVDGEWRCAQDQPRCLDSGE